MTDFEQLNPVFYDCEASSLDGFPIEIGCACVDASKTMTSESHLIAPDRSWDVRGSWERRAERLHGIALETLLTTGESTIDVAKRMNDRLADRQLFADSSYDETWILQLFDSAGITPKFAIRRMLSDVLVRQFAASRRIGPDAYMELLAQTRLLWPPTHRAGPDARYWAHAWLAIMRNTPLQVPHD